MVTILDVTSERSIGMLATFGIAKSLVTAIFRSTSSMGLILGTCEPLMFLLWYFRIFSIWFWVVTLTELCFLLSNLFKYLTYGLLSGLAILPKSSRGRTLGSVVDFSFLESGDLYSLFCVVPSRKSFETSRYRLILRVTFLEGLGRIEGYPPEVVTSWKVAVLWTASLNIMLFDCL